MGQLAKKLRIQLDFVRWALPKAIIINNLPSPTGEYPK